ncbi:extracellular solute-binding protein [Cohnella sp. NL03-T5]|uniref:Extracellular solute-binding protein n=1 Tax=Cohnella silvisoli TaxID=2873699 RepID=A0ABV1KZW2_9BACL|nr:extracellular solute-binding protein [Cohnella silvisoli]
MASRKLALVFLLLCIMVVILSPWADAPSPSTPIVPVPSGEDLATAKPVVAEEISRLTVEVAMEEPEFQALVDQNDEFIAKHPDISVELHRIDPQHAYSTYKQAAQMEELADVILLSNEWVKEFAVSGYLLPADAAFVGKALTEQFDVLIAPLKWNGSYLWGVPRDMDPYVLVWNMDLLHGWLGEDVTLPLTIEQWTALTAKSSELQGAFSWLTIDRNDPLAMLAWLENAVGERSDGLWTDGSKPWEGTPFEQALTLLDQQRAGVKFIDNASEAASTLKAGTTLAAIVPYSLAAPLVAEPRISSDSKLELDHQTWKLPYVWPRGSSFSISSTTEDEDAAYKWIAEMTDAPNQLHNLEERNLLPVYRTLYDNDRRLSNLLPGRNGQTFPNQSPLIMGPDMAARLEKLGGLWRKFTTGVITLDDWKKEWID